jgi:hypothetical protein
MKLPEFSLDVCGQGCCGRLTSKFMTGKWKIFNDELDIIRILVQHLLEEWL